MIKVKSNVRRIKAAIEGARRAKFRVPTIHVYPRIANDHGFAMTVANDPQFWKDVAERFLKEEMLPYLQAEFFKRANDTIHWPRVIQYREGMGPSKYGIRRGQHSSNRYQKYHPITGKRVWRIHNLAQGFVDLFEQITKKRVFVDERAVRVGIGPMRDVLRLRLNEYMPTFGGKGTNSEWNTLFYAVEYGTGVRENVGGGKWVRKEGPTKAASPPGSWWLGEPGEGAHFVGQKGFHLFYEEETRYRNRQLQDEIKRRWVRFVSEYISNHPEFGNRLVAKRFG